MRKLILLMSLVLAVGQAQALSTTTGNELLEWCSSPNPSPSFLACAMYIMGAEDGHEYTKIWDSAVEAAEMELERKAVQGIPTIRNYYCPPGRSTHGQDVLVVKQYLAEHPEKLHEPAAGLVLHALMGAFPCK